MYIKTEALKQLETFYGCPQVLKLKQEISFSEMTMLQASQKHGRSHDFTFFIIDENNHLVVIRKHQHPSGFYRAPSGGSEPEEDLTQAIQREAMEETGLKITLEKYILKVKAVFQSSNIKVPWTSHVFIASSQFKSLCPIDTKEIKEAKWVSWNELQGPIRNNLQTSPFGLFHYRVTLTDTVSKLLNQEY